MRPSGNSIDQTARTAHHRAPDAAHPTGGVQADQPVAFQRLRNMGYRLLLGSDIKKRKKCQDSFRRGVAIKSMRRQNPACEPSAFPALGTEPSAFSLAR